MTHPGIKNLLCPALLIVAALGTLLFTASCSSSDDPEPRYTTAEETVIFLAPYSGSLSSSVASDIDDFVKAFKKSNAKGRQSIVVFKTYSPVRAMMETVKWDGKAYTCDTLVANWAVNFTSGDQTANTILLQDIISRAKAAAPAKSYSLIVGSHGKGGLPAGHFNLTDLDGQYPRPQKAFGTATTDAQIDETALAAALQHEGVKLNFLLFDACYMANVESAYAMRNVCTTYISSPNEILSDGMPYEEGTAALLSHDYKAFADAYYNHYAGTGDPYATISVTDCSKLAELASVVAGILRNAFNASADLYEVQPMDGYNPALTYDLGDYIHHFCSDSALLDTFDNLMKQVVLYERHTDEFITAVGSGRYNRIRSFSGLSTLLPTTNAGAAEYAAATEWAKAVRP